ncbi:leucine--tRNA ligase [Candidatus Woesearchaeota archaeon]|nr:leucine--tRNA ligase [Candidatus Woesearchaeota archaeon]
MTDADFVKIAGKWQKRWADSGIFTVKEDVKKKKFYCLEMYPYPSEKLHMGHLRNYSIGDALARYKRMKGYNVLYPMGFDAFGLPAENAAIKNRQDPEKWTISNMDTIRQQMKDLGYSYDWDREIASLWPDYYKWNQWIFLKFLEKGLAYKKKASVNWCPSCNTVLANEQVDDGKCWRCKSEVTETFLDQWFFRITAYAEELLKDLDKLTDWPERVRVMQENWIGKSEGVNLRFKVKDMDVWFEVFDSVPQTFMAQTFTVIAPEHPMVYELVKGTKYEKPVMEFVENIKRKKAANKFDVEKEMEGIFTGKYIEYTPAKRLLPIWVASFVIYEYGTGVVNASAHDERDFDFAKKYNLPLNPVMFPTDKKEAERVKNLEYAYCKAVDGVLQSPEEFKGRKWGEARENIIRYIEKHGYGKRTAQYKLRDWLISRQRYWGTPIPVVYCDKCGLVAVPYDELPVLLPKPDEVKFTGKGNPLETSREFVRAKCPKCKGSAKRETDTMDTFVDSSWYFFRYTSPKYGKLPFDRQAASYWMPVDQYIGGIEHAVMHLLYARFFTKALRDLGLHKVDEPFSRLLCQGMVIKNGAKMSKSIGNIVDPAEIYGKYGPDTARLFILFASAPEKELDWNDRGVDGSYRFLKRLYAFVEKSSFAPERKAGSELGINDRFVQSFTQKTIRLVTSDLESYSFNIAITRLMELADKLKKYSEGDHNTGILKSSRKSLLVMLSPFVPHICEELWEKTGGKGFVSLQDWPVADEKLIDKNAEAFDEFAGTIRKDIMAVLELASITQPKKITVAVADKWKYELFSIVAEQMKSTRDISTIMKKVVSSDIKSHAGEASSLVQKLLKDPGRLSAGIGDQKTEANFLDNLKDEIEKEFKFRIEIVYAEKSNEPKSRQALPGKPAIIAE